jgi:hypothetical protein
MTCIVRYAYEYDAMYGLKQKDVLGWPFNHFSLESDHKTASKLLS